MLTAPDPTIATERAEPCSVLIVDDEPFNIELLAQELEEEGHEVITACDGVEAIERIVEGGCDLVLLDIMMPRMTGIEVLERLQTEGRLAELPVIVVSALDDIERVARCIQLGAEDHLVKPFDPVLLKARMAGAIEKKRDT